MNTNIQYANFEKINELLNVYEKKMGEEYLFGTPSHSYEHHHVKIAQIYSLQKFAIGLDTYIPTVSDFKQKEELMVLSQQINVEYSDLAIQLLMQIEIFYQRFFGVCIHMASTPLKVQGTLSLSKKTWLVELDHIESHMSIESQVIPKLKIMLKQWQQQANKTAQDELAIQQLSSELYKVDEHRNKYHRYNQVDSVQTICALFYHLKFENYEKYRLQDVSLCQTPYIFKFPFVPEFQPPGHLISIGEQVLKSKEIPASSDKNHDVWVELMEVFLDQCISQLIESLQAPEYKCYEEVIKIHIEELRYSQGAKYKLIIYIKFYHIGLFGILTVYKS